MAQRKIQEVDFTNSIDYLNFTKVKNHLPVLDILNERFLRIFRVDLSNYIKTISNITSDSRDLSFSEWKETLTKNEYMFVGMFNSFDKPIIVRFDREMAYGIIDILTGGTGRSINDFQDKEYTALELSLLKTCADLIIKGLNEAWAPVEKIYATYVRTEVNPEFIGVVSPNTNTKVSDFEVSFGTYRGSISVLYPYTTIFPMRDKLYQSARY